MGASKLDLTEYKCRVEAPSKQAELERKMKEEQALKSKMIQKMMLEMERKKKLARRNENIKHQVGYFAKWINFSE